MEITFVSIPLDIDDEIDIVYLKHEKATLSKMGEKFLDNLVKEVTFDNSIDVSPQHRMLGTFYHPTVQFKCTKKGSIISVSG